MKCLFCKGLLEDSTTYDYSNLNNCIIIIQGVPCQKCTQCLEIIFDFSTGERIEEMVDTLKDSLTDEIAVVQYSETEIPVVRYSKNEAA
jgi:YgiT-type zinc finger domain-containing protein